MKVLDRHIILELLGPFVFTLVAISSLILVANLFSSLDEFIQNKAPLSLILEYYRAFIPGMMTIVLPTTMLFSSLYSLLRLSHNAELTAMQACGVPLWRVYVPFIALAVLCTVGLYCLTVIRGGNAKARQEAILAQIRGHLDSEYTKKGQVYQDRASGRVWYLQTLNLHLNQAKGVEVLEVTAEGRDDVKFFAQRAEWKGGFWTLYDVHSIRFGEQGQVIGESNVPELPEPDWKESPLDMSALQIKPELLTFRQLRDVDGRLNWQSEIVMAPYRTQLYILLTEPLMIIILTLFALVDGTTHSRKSSSGGVFNAIFLLIIFFVVLHIFQAMGRGGRVSPAVATLTPLVLFAMVGAIRLAPKFGFLPFKLGKLIRTR